MFKYIQCANIQIFPFILSAFDGETVNTNEQPLSDLKIFTFIHSFMKMYVLYCKVKKVHQPLQLRQKCSFNTSNNKLQQDKSQQPLKRLPC